MLLSRKIEETTIVGKKVFSVAASFLMACFDENISDETITAVAKPRPYHFVMRDSSLASNSTTTNFDQFFAAYSPIPLGRCCNAAFIQKATSSERVADIPIYKDFRYTEKMITSSSELTAEMILILWFRIP